jgi:hypothetical protein
MAQLVLSVSSERIRKVAMSLPAIRSHALMGLLSLLLAATVVGQSALTDRPLSANEMVRAVVANELNAQGANHSRWMYRADREEQGKKKTNEVVQTGHGSLDRLVEVDGHALSAKEQEDERQRIENLVRHPAEQQKLEQTQRKDPEHWQTFFKMIPDALSFSYAGRDGTLIKLSYKPNPSFHPPSREASVFRAMEGEMWVDESQRRLVSIGGHLIADVKFAGGLLGYVDKGSNFDVEQCELAPGQWEVTFLEVNMQGKALFFKNIAVQEKEFRSDFRPVPAGLTVADAEEMLKEQVQVMVAASQ